MLLLALAMLMACAFSAQIGIYTPSARPVVATRTEREEDEDTDDDSEPSDSQTDEDDGTTDDSTSSGDSATASQSTQSWSQSASEDTDTEGETPPPGSETPPAGSDSDDNTTSTRSEADVDDAWVRSETRDGRHFYLLRDDDGTHRWYEHLDYDSFGDLPEDRDRSTTQIQLREATDEFGEVAENKPPEPQQEEQRPVSITYAVGEDGESQTETYTEYYTDTGSRVGGAFQDADYTGKLIMTPVNQSEYGPDKYGELEQTVHMLEEGHGLTLIVQTPSKDDPVRPVVGFDSAGNAYWRDDDGNLVQVDGRLAEIFNSDGAYISAVSADGGGPPVLQATEGVIANPYRDAGGGDGSFEAWWDSLTPEDRARASRLYTTYEGGYIEGSGYTAEATQAYEELKEWQGDWQGSYQPEAPSRPEGAVYWQGDETAPVQVEYASGEDGASSTETYTEYYSDDGYRIGIAYHDTTGGDLNIIPVNQREYGPDKYGELQQTVHMLAEGHGMTVLVGPNLDEPRPVVGFDEAGNAYWRDDSGNLVQARPHNEVFGADGAYISAMAADGGGPPVLQATPNVIANPYQADSSQWDWWNTLTP